ncbi:MAG: ferrochelatase [Gammaproteobacteria bacterium RIFCSPLOWO2_02_FULL_42_14]|nr:MAG: ferrochelatase [Gammaproteobacteria bacterium RIFCSPHIGHO2_02_FULL_42_43]OGT28683.1 MAG: ferrochelatase [Gammaproteobacteria bacterium RIFCSPHIGHO2_01_FULL_42_8]OGT51586.1 MAG: ferrochelatase [Gammaproteobacteria bacterium RIFCSPHIGHO2_12_FULL_41_25]OGT62285.1 MAG: ferrochelatase [Gammaproteobacteria bacterium RIFCSPLOWO2_02_FULL_42_14]OGT85959.1 MAG: ferrochelatase [Gammaproteobacteria bacterium RIFCSPLOWO2_12_FULL_42_18]
MIGVLLIHLGTPEAPTEAAIKTYLREFLLDPNVIELPRFAREFLVNKIILKRRLASSVHAYQQIWTKQGSPLLVNSLQLKEALQTQIDFPVALGMRYSNPSISEAIHELREKKCDKIITLPLFPQYAKAIAYEAQTLSKDNSIFYIKEFHTKNFYIDAYSSVIRNTLQINQSEFLLMSFHGLPKRASGASDYRKQCAETSSLLAQQLKLSRDQYQMTFQSRLGLTPWLKPYTDRALISLRKKNITRLTVACPSFITDCVETLEEINIRLRDQWMKLGGKTMDVAPCLNANAEWVAALVKFIIQNIALQTTNTYAQSAMIQKIY